MVIKAAVLSPYNNFLPVDRLNASCPNVHICLMSKLFFSPKKTTFWICVVVIFWNVRASTVSVGNREISGHNTSCFIRRNIVHVYISANKHWLSTAPRGQLSFTEVFFIRKLSTIILCCVLQQEPRETTSGGKNERKLLWRKKVSLLSIIHITLKVGSPFFTCALLFNHINVEAVLMKMFCTPRNVRLWPLQLCRV